MKQRKVYIVKFPGLVSEGIALVVADCSNRAARFLITHLEQFFPELFESPLLFLINVKEKVKYFCDCTDRTRLVVRIIKEGNE